MKCPNLPFPFFLLPAVLWMAHFVTEVHAQDTTKIILERADTWEYNRAIGADVQRIIGDAVLRHAT